MPGGVVFGQRDAHSASFGSRSSLTAAVCAEVTLLVGALGAGSPVSGALAAIAAFAAAAAARSGRCCGAASTVLVAIGREAGGRAATASRLLAGFWSGNSGVDDDDELNINTPTPCQIGKRPPAAPKPKRESAGHQGVAGGGYLWSHELPWGFCGGFGGGSGGGGGARLYHTNKPHRPNEAGFRSNVPFSRTGMRLLNGLGSTRHGI